MDAGSVAIIIIVIAAVALIALRIFRRNRAPDIYGLPRSSERANEEMQTRFNALEGSGMTPFPKRRMSSNEVAKRLEERRRNKDGD